MIDQTSPVITDPQPGDTMTYRGVTRTILERSGSMVIYQLGSQSDRWTASVDEWNDVAAEAVAVHTAERKQ